MARFFSQLAPDSPQSIPSPASRRQMAQCRWRDPCNLFESHYGLGTMLSAPGPREWMGHTGSLQGFLSRTARYPALDLTVTVLTNAQDGLSTEWVEGIASILFAAFGLALSWLADLPSGIIIALCMAMMGLISIFIAPRQ